jgi:hypothetical protein
MRRIRNVGGKLVKGLLGASALAVLGAICAGSAHGQGFAPSPPPPSQFNPNFPNPNLQAPNLNYSPLNFPSAPAPQAGADESPWYLDLAKALGAFVIVVLVLLVVALVFRQLARARATTDPVRLAASDYWIQSQLRQVSSDEGDVPPDEQPPE